MTVKIKYDVFQRIKETIGNLTPETGGILGCKGDVVCSYYFDDKSICPHEYEPSIADINYKLAEWLKEEIHFAGIIHSHPNDCRNLSKGDVDSILAIFKKTNFSGTLFFPIVTNQKRFTLTFYYAQKINSGISIKKAKYLIKRTNCINNF